MTTTVVELDAGHVDALERFFADVGEGDLTFVKEDVSGPEAVRGWLRPGRQWLALDRRGRRGRGRGRRLRRRPGGAVGHVLRARVHGEALLPDHVRDREGGLHDLVLLAHHVEATAEAMRAIGLEEEMAPQ